MQKGILILLLSMVSFAVSAQKVRIAAASNLRYVLEAIKPEFEKQNPDVVLEIIYGSSGSLSQQIVNGAAYDVFLAADDESPRKLKALGLVSGEVVIYALGTLVMWSNSVDVSKGLPALDDQSVRRIAIAKPELAPYGASAIECLNYYRLFGRLKTKLVYADNIAQAAQFTQTGNAEIGFLAFSLAIAPEMKGTYFKLDPKSYQPIKQAMVLVKGSVNPKARRFFDYLQRAECKSVFEKYGYLDPEKAI